MQDCKTCSTKKIDNIVSGLCDRCSVIITAYHRYYESNIPLEYWNLTMEKNFSGSPSLMKIYQEITSDLALAYKNGTTVCFAGQHGSGKTFTATSILRKCCHKNYVVLYTTLSDVVNILMEASFGEKFEARKELMTVDFLVMDEVDSRFMLTENSADLFGKMLEHIFRTRSQNKLPTIFCSNSPNPTEMFNGSIKQSIESLMNRVKIIPIIDKDFRKTQGK